MDFLSLFAGLIVGLAVAGSVAFRFKLQLTTLQARQDAESHSGSLAIAALREAAQQVLQQSTPQLMQLTEAKLKETQLNSKNDLTALLGPIKENLDQLTQHNRALELSRTESYAQLTLQIAGLQNKTEHLDRTLRKPHGRGRWGEVQLQRLLELSGMESYSDYSLQESYDSTDGDSEGTGKRRLRPDCVISLPGGRKVVVDVKTPLDAYMDAEHAPDAEAHKLALARHANQLRKHMEQLAGKEYRALEPSADFVVLFVPGEHLVSAALREDPNLFDDALAKNVIIASTATLMMLLKAYAFGWRQEGVVETANEAVKAGRELHLRLKTMVEHFQKVGGSLASAMKSFNAAVGSYESRVEPAARKLASYSLIETTRGDETMLEPVEEIVPRLEAARNESAEILPLTRDQA